MNHIYKKSEDRNLKRNMASKKVQLPPITAIIGELPPLNLTSLQSNATPDLPPQRMNNIYENPNNNSQISENFGQNPQNMEIVNNSNFSNSDGGAEATFNIDEKSLFAKQGNDSGRSTEDMSPRDEDSGRSAPYTLSDDLTIFKVVASYYGFGFHGKIPWSFWQTYKRVTWQSRRRPSTKEIAITIIISITEAT
ncbi:hypothetical protein TRFO_17389 [Tritrichomonas foetus]|uniref:Uncharacterized protein n=1 Tax=Tritrichomonas foetus TaxID=1144522 RepID=A0A1J4KS89_9EUKA|nr:hypothetical protein TRFO_17389 [Tritrichomonas foetus]|eukprot:OHT12684.1 hypothetical protein TRFO_17389 [Tritrichomonas foetus]